MPGVDCLIQNGMLVTCDDLRRVGGVNKRFWVYNIDGMDRAVGEQGYTISGSGFVTAMAFNTYGGIYEFEGQRKSHSGGWKEANAAGGNRFFIHDVIMKLLNTTPWDDQVIEDLLVADVGVILETNNLEFLIYGGFNGMSMEEGVQNTGQELESDEASILTFAGQEQKLPKRFFTTDYATTLALIVGYQI